MTEANRDNLSAGIDGELGREELRFLLRRMEHDSTLQATWSRYHVARDGLRRELPVLASKDFASRVMRALDRQVAAEQLTATSAARRPQRGHWLRLSAGGAIAASVAVAALMASRPVGQAGGEHAASLPSQTLASAAVQSPATQAPLTAPASVPAWLSNSNAFRYSQQASATYGAPSDALVSPYAQSLSPYQVQQGYRTIQNGDGSYLLLVDPTRQALRRPGRVATSAPQ
jgi:sigma-E factor negative regulatory protein RseA